MSERAFKDIEQNLPTIYTKNFSLTVPKIYLRIIQHYEIQNPNYSVYSPRINSKRSEFNSKEKEENNVKEDKLVMKSLINTDDGSDLSQLSPALTCIRALNESGFLLDDERSKFVKSLSLKELKSEEEISRKDGFLFAVSLRDGACLYTSEAITHHIGYPKDMLVGQCFMNFLYHKDHITFANHLTQGLNACFTQGKRDDSHLVLNTFFCRIRVYQGLKYGYSVADKKPQYKPFKIILHINELIFDDVCVEKPMATLCVKATATQVLSAYSVPEEIPAMTSFSTRHTATCHFSHVDASAIPYLGFLPQDMVGYSVFDFYHIDDMPHLKEIYEYIMKEHGTSFRSKPYRFKIHNGCYVMLETEWSCFINPWSHNFEFVVGQHRVLKGPSDINIFTPCEILEVDSSNEIVKESQAIQKEIKEILSKPLQNFESKRNKRICSKRKRDLASFVYNCIDETYKSHKKEATEKQDSLNDERSHSDLDSAVMGDISPLRDVTDSNISSPTTVQQMRYQENIDRFFASQPKTYSDGSDGFSKYEKTSSVEEYQGSSSGSGNGSGSGKASANTSKDQETASPNYDHKVKESGSSSSKCNMSSFTTGDSGFGKSWEKDGNNESGSSQAGISKQTSVKIPCEKNTNSISFASCLALTEETLCAHNKNSHKQIKQRKNNTKASVSQKECNRLQQSEVHQKNKKSPRNHNLASPTACGAINPNETQPAQPGCQQFPPKFPLNDQDTSASTPQTSFPCNHHPNTLPGSTAPFFIPVVYMGSLPCYPSISAMTPFWPHSPMSNSEISQSGCSFNPTCSPHLNTLTSGFPFPAFPSCFGSPFCHHGVRSSGVTTTPIQSTTTTTVATETPITFLNSFEAKKQPMFMKEDTTVKANIEKLKNQGSEGDESDMQFEESLSSSFTKSSQLQDKDEDMELDDKKFYTASISDKVELNSEIAYRYQMNLSNIEDVLKKDRELLKMMQQPDLVNKQLKMLQEEIRDENENKVKCEKEFSITEEMMLGLTKEESVTEELEYREASLLQLMCEAS